MPTAQKALAIGVFILILGLAFPTFITAANMDAASNSELSEGGTVEIVDGLDLTANSVYAANATLTLTDTDTFEKQTETIDVGNKTEYTLRGERINVSVVSTDTDPILNTTIVSAEHERTYGWNDSAKTIANNIGLLLAILTLIIGAAMVMVVMQ